jgi:hypothetical protein
MSSMKTRLIDPQQKTADFDRKLIQFSLGLLLVLFFFGFCFYAEEAAVKVDFVTYWSSAKLLASHLNPYDSQRIAQMQAEYGSRPPVPFIMRNPPWVLPLIAPLGYLGIKSAYLCSLIFEILLSLISIHLLRRLYGIRKTPWIGYFFFALLICVLCGQSTIFVLFGCAVYLFAGRNRPLLGGSALALMTVKPHLVLFFWPILLVESWRKKDLRPLAVCGVLFLSAVAIAVSLDHHVFAHYLAAMQAQKIDTQLLPNFSSGMRMLLAPKLIWLQTIPILCGLVWAGSFYWNRRDRWSWPEYLPLLIAVSTLLSPYSWTYDQTMFLPLILQGSVRRSSTFSNSLAIAANAIPVVAICSGLSQKSPFYLFVTVAWLVWWISLRYASPANIQQGSLAPHAPN